MPSLRKFDAGLYAMGPPEAAPPGTLRRGTGLARLTTDSAKSRCGGNKLVDEFNTVQVNSMTYFNGSRYYSNNNGKFCALATKDKIHEGLVGKLTYVTAPVAPAQPDYLFATDGAQLFKMAPDETVSNWGIEPFDQDSFTVERGTGLERSINQLSLLGGITAYNSTTFEQETVLQAQGAACAKLTGPVSASIGETYGIYLNATMDLSLYPDDADAPSPDEDYISLQVRLTDPNAIEYILIGFAIGESGVGAAYDSDARAPNEFLHVARFSDGKPLSSKQYGIASKRSKRAQRDAVRRAANRKGGFDDDNSNASDPDTTDNLRAELIGNASIQLPPNPDAWFQLRIPKDAFFKAGDQSFTWANVLGWKLGYKLTDNATVAPTVYFDDFKLAGAYGLQGTYQCQITAKNSVTGAESNPTPLPVTVEDVQRQPLVWTLPETHPDPQVDTIVLYRTLGDGGLFFKDQEIFLGAEYLVDGVADSPGLITAAGEYLQQDEMLWTNIVPEATCGDICGLHLGRMWLTRDSAEGKGSWVYYSRAGYPEGMEGYIAVGNDDEQCQKLVIWNRSLYLFTLRGVYQINGTAPPFIPVQVRDIPGTRYPDSIQPTPFGIVYEADDGFRVFNGTASTLAPSAPILAIFQGQALTNLPRWSGTVCSCAGLDFYYVTDGTTLLCLTSDGRWRDVGITGVCALNFEVPTGKFTVFFNRYVQYLEQEENAWMDAGNQPVTVEWEFPHVLTATDNQRGVLRRITLDIELDGQQITPTLIIDGTEETLPPITNTTRGLIEIARNTPCRSIGLRLAGSFNLPIELYAIDVDVHVGQSSK